MKTENEDEIIRCVSVCTGISFFHFCQEVYTEQRTQVLSGRKSARKDKDRTSVIPLYPPAKVKVVSYAAFVPEHKEGTCEVTSYVGQVSIASI